MDQYEKDLIEAYEVGRALEDKLNSIPGWTIVAGALDVSISDLVQLILDLIFDDVQKEVDAAKRKQELRRIEKEVLERAARRMIDLSNDPTLYETIKKLKWGQSGTTRAHTRKRKPRPRNTQPCPNEPENLMDGVPEPEGIPDCE